MSVDTTEAAVAAVPAPTVVRQPRPGGVVVGIDGSVASRAALEFGCDEAALRALPVAAVVAWTPPEAWVTPYPLLPTAHDLQDAALHLAREEIGAVLATRAARGASTPEIDLVAVSGPAAVVLERLSAHASMLVVGHRGRGAIASRLIGSVGLSAVVHAHCTVVVVRPPAAGDAGPGESGIDEHGSHAT